MSKNKYRISKKGGKMKPLNSGSLKATALVTYKPEYGNNHMSGANGFLTHRSSQQQRLNDAFRGGKMTKLNHSRITVPQFNNVNPSMPFGGDQSSQVTNINHLTNIQNKKYDHYADVIGGNKRTHYKPRKSRKHRKRKSIKPRKSKTFRKKTHYKPRKSKKFRKMLIN